MRQLLPVSSLLLAGFILVFGNGVATLLLPARASAEGWSAGIIALMGSAYALAFTAGCVIVPRVVARVGHIRVFAALGTLTTMSMLLHAMEVEPWFWILVRAMAGLSIAGSYMILESWLNEATSNESRGLVFSAYMVTTMAGLAAGPFLVSFGSTSGFELFAWAAIVYAVATLPITLTAARTPQPLARFDLDLKALYRNSPASFVGSLLTGAVAGSWSTLAPVYGVEIGLSTAATATLLAAATAGAMVFQMPIGRLSDRVDRRVVMVAVGAAGAGIAFLIALVGGSSGLLTLLVFLFGATIYSTYALNVAHANDWASGVSFVTVASGLLILYGIGSTIGPLVVGQAMRVLGPEGLFAGLAATQLAYAAFAFYRITRRADAPEEDQVDFAAQPSAVGATPQTFELDPRADDEGEFSWSEAEERDYGVAGEA